MVSTATDDRAARPSVDPAVDPAGGSARVAGSTGLVAQLESRLAEPTAKGLAAAVSRAIRDGALHPGDRLPPIRELAQQLTLSPTTVSAAWALLTRAGTLRTAGRRGTVVADGSAPHAGRYRQALERQTTFGLDLSTGVPDETLLPKLDVALATLQTGSPQSYLDDPVLPELHHELVTCWPYEPPALTVVDGAMDALELVIRSALRYGDRVLVEHPTFPPMLDLLESAGVEVVGVRLDEDGPLEAEVADALRLPTRAVILQPRGQNPTGVSMSAERAEALAAQFAAADVLVIEDDSTSAISLSADISIGSVLPNQTVHIRSYSKSHGPDLRLAAMSGPAEVLGDVRRLRQLGQGWTSRLLQRLLLGLLTDDQSRTEVAAAAVEYARRRSEFVDELGRHGIAVGGTDGLNAWVPVHDEAAALMRLAAHGVGVAPGAPFSVLPGDQPHVRVTTGLIRGDRREVAREVAAASRTESWSTRTR